MPGVIRLRPQVVNIAIKPTKPKKVKKNVPRSKANPLRRVPATLVKTNQPKYG